jgi:hypothetical protein
MTRISNNNSNNNRSWCFVRANNVHKKRKKPAREIQMDLLLAVLNVISLSCRAVLISRFSHKSSVSLPRLDYLCLCTMECYCNGSEIDLPTRTNTKTHFHRTPLDMNVDHMLLYVPVVSRYLIFTRVVYGYSCFLS